MVNERLRLEFIRLQNLFRSELPKRVANLEQAWETKDYANLKLITHSICGTSLTMGFHAIGKFSRALENAINQELSVQELEPLYLQLLAELKEPSEPERLYG